VQCCHETGLRRGYSLVVAIRLSRHSLCLHNHQGFWHKRADDQVGQFCEMPKHSSTARIIFSWQTDIKISEIHVRKHAVGGATFLILISWRRQELSFTRLLFPLQPFTHSNHERMRCVFSQAMESFRERVISNNNLASLS
jgi:hypothetical protein